MILDVVVITNVARLLFVTLQEFNPGYLYFSDPIHLPENHLPEITFPRKTLGRNYIIPNIHFPERAFSRNYISLNIHLPEITFS